ncbi:MAG TPA: hypothetical protein H9867_09060 [Candidatus Corynebacterium gallistercoris]|uniref:Uncharacterized protein n=1 Tax=Candidatus Corynebacterium gallistercoris TaxID=2838530 RepID=A0A9D1RZG3_9CORY|nr:hypothetical protein [Candidatus Corynebacterium gallistercoris]
MSDSLSPLQLKLLEEVFPLEPTEHREPRTSLLGGNPHPYARFKIYERSLRYQRESASARIVQPGLLRISTQSGVEYVEHDQQSYVDALLGLVAVEPGFRVMWERTSKQLEVFRGERGCALKLSKEHQKEEPDAHQIQ